MRLLLRASLRQLLVQRGATITVFSGIGLAMLSVVAVHLLSDQIQRELERSNGAAVLGLTHTLRRAGLTEDDYFALRRQWRAGELPEVSTLVPMITGRADALTDEGPVVVEILGFDPLAGALPGADRPTPRPDPGWLQGTVAWAADARIPEGTRLRFGESLQVTIAAVDSMSSGGTADPLVLVDIGLAQRILGRPGSLDAVGAVRLDEIGPWARVLDRLFPGLGARRYVTEQVWEVAGYGVEDVRDRGERLFAGAVLFNVSALGLLSVVVAAFLIHQAAVNAIRQREVVFDRLRSMGATERSLLGYVVMEGLLVALIGAGVGAIAGWWCAGWLFRSMLGGGPLEGLDFAHATLIWAFGKALIFGPAVGALSMWLAYRSVRGRSVRGRSTRGRSVGAGRAGGPWRGGRGAVLVLCALLLGLGATRPSSGVVGAFAAIAGVTFAGALAVVPILALWLRPRSGRRLLAALNRRSLGHRRADVGVAVGGLVVALATACGMSLMVASFRAAFEEMLDQRLDAEVYLQSEGGFAPAGERELRAALGSSDALRFEQRDSGWLSVGARREAVQVIHDTARSQVRYGFHGELPADGMLLGEPGANRLGLREGDRVVLAGNRAELPMLVRGVFRDYGAATPRVVISPGAGDALFGASRSRAAAIYTRDARTVERLKVLAAEREWRFRSNAAVRAFALGVFERTFRISDALVVIAVAVAGIGLFNALMAARLRRAREFRLLHDMGLSPGERVRMNLSYAAMLGLHAVVLALPVGLCVGWLLCDVLNPRAFGWSIPFAVDWRSLALPAILGLVSSVVAGLAPVATVSRVRADAA